MGVHVPFWLHVRLEGPNNSNPLSHVYVAIVPSWIDSVVNVTLACAGEPGYPHDSAMKKVYKN